VPVGSICARCARMIVGWFVSAERSCSRVSRRKWCSLITTMTAMMTELMMCRCLTTALTRQSRWMNTWRPLSWPVCLAAPRHRPICQVRLGSFYRQYSISILPLQAGPCACSVGGMALVKVDWSWLFQPFETICKYFRIPNVISFCWNTVLGTFYYWHMYSKI